MKALKQPATEHTTADPEQQVLDRMTDQELRRIYLEPGRVGDKAFLTLSARNIARRPFRLK